MIFIDKETKSFTLDREVAFERIEVEVVVIKAPSSVLGGTVDNQSVILPVRNVSEAICAIVVVDCYCRQSFPIRNEATGNFESLNYSVGF